MSTLTPAQIAQHARAAGLTNADRLATAVAIAMGESGGNPAAHNPVGLDDSFGLWQINMRGAQGPQRRRALGIASNNALFDPATNARAMMMISKQGADFTPWTVYTRGIYLVHLPAARAAVNAAPPTTGGGAAGGDNPLIPDVIEGGVDAVAGAAQAGAEAVRLATGASRWLADRHNWLRVSYVTGGGVLLVVALLIASRDPDSVVGKVVKGTKKTAEGAANLAMMVAPQGKAAKAVGGMKAAGGASKAAGGASKAASSGGAKAASAAPKVA